MNLEKLPPILYAEDNENDIELSLLAFQESHIRNQIDVVNDGQQVIDYLMCEGAYQNRERINPVVILLDIKMPKVDGIEALRFIRSKESLKNIPIVMLTSSAMERDMVESYELGANAYVIKPVDFNEFMQSVKDIGVFWAIVNKTI